MVTIVDYGMGNLGSIVNMIKKIGGESLLTSEKSKIEKAEKLILPGVGAFDNGMKHINELGLTEVLNRKAVDEKTPILGICLGMQLLTKGSEEGILPGLGWVDAQTVKFRSIEPLPIPHMGWNAVSVKKANPLINNNNPDTRFYFVHSYYVKCDQPEDILLTTNYGIEFVSGIQHNNIWGVQFHPEKSHKFGMRLLTNFLAI